jgi:C4-dicarboxylate-specific signal transduction histidine kinase
MSDAQAEPESPAESRPPAPVAQSQQPEIHIDKESESPERLETGVQGQQEVELSPETASVEQDLETQNPETGMSATAEEEPAQTSVEIDDAPHPAEEEAAPSPIVGRDSGPSAGGSPAPAEDKSQVMRELREKFLAAANLAELKQIKAAYGHEISNAVWKCDSFNLKGQ